MTQLCVKHAIGQMAAAALLAGLNLLDDIQHDIFAHFCRNFADDTLDFVFELLNALWIGRIDLFLHVSPIKIIQRRLTT